jgi:hypothetical protein
MKAKLILCVIALPVMLLMSGCFSTVTETVRTEFRVNPETGMEMVSPKDVTIKSADFDPETGTLKIRGYQSAANAAAIAQAGAAEKARSETMQYMFQMMAMMRANEAPSTPPPQPSIAPERVEALEARLDALEDLGDTE